MNRLVFFFVSLTSGKRKPPQGTASTYSSLEKLHRIHLVSAIPHLKMQVRPGRVSGRSHFRDDLALLHGLPGGYRQNGTVPVQGFIPVTVRDPDIIPVSSRLSRRTNSVEVSLCLVYVFALSVAIRHLTAGLLAIHLSMKTETLF